MKVDEIKSTKDFLGFLSKQNNNNFLPQTNDEYSKSICGTNFTSEVLYILPRTETLKNIENYNNLRYITINNYKVDKKGIEILREHKEKLLNVNFLDIWNIKQNDLDILELFPNLTHLLVSYIGKPDFSFNGLDYLKKLGTLCFSSINKITDFHFLTKSQKQIIKNLSLTYTANLTHLDGIEDFENLETRSLFASTPESRKKVTLENLNGLEKLSKLKSFDIGYFKFDIEELKSKLLHLKHLKQYSIDYKTYENR
ncbi:MAG: hypothetical protein LBV72_13435 [Tannerella sp.]|jgi:hypothetical protein|nr:hypothetical protein [Tannerella sp.]